MNNNNFINNGFNSNLQSEIFTFEIPGIKIIVIPTFSPMASSFQTNHSEIFTFDIPGSKGEERKLALKESEFQIFAKEAATRKAISEAEALELP
ncbi:hypothetical protein GLOIN_2v1884337 [Rhizophagus irregularis DAOM 181602=DAOM 197198]|nr:hypothetical protein GLOIN_2v1884337 [Rhizophagus irregularis DAOM 181602=DAOM 197198]